MEFKLKPGDIGHNYHYDYHTVPVLTIEAGTSLKYK